VFDHGNRDGDSFYAAATPVTQSFNVALLTPAATSITPDTVPAFSGAITLTVNGSDFGISSTVLFTPPGGTAFTLIPTAIQAAQLTVAVPAGYLNAAGAAQVAVNNGFGAVSNSLPLTITVAGPAIAFDAIPNQILGGSPFAIAAQAKSGLPVAVSSTTPAICKTASNLVMLLSAGTVRLRRARAAIQ
jgi:trimeric autotransporter adhesin